MSDQTPADDPARIRRFTRIIRLYPVALILLAVAINLLLFGLNPVHPALPDPQTLVALSVAAALLLLNHTWLMTNTELTRLRHGLHATPEEWQASGKRRADSAPDALQELERRHNAHRNATENSVIFALLALPFCLSTPDSIAALVWLVGFPVARLGYTFSYLGGRDDLRGLCMSAGLLCLYGLATALLGGALAGRV